MDGKRAAACNSISIFVRIQAIQVTLQAHTSPLGSWSARRARYLHGRSCRSGACLFNSQSKSDYLTLQTPKRKVIISATPGRFVLDVPLSAPL